MNQKSRSTWWIAAIIIGLGGSLALPMGLLGQAFTFRDQAFIGNNVATAAGGGGLASFSDNFNRADNASMGANWTEIAGNIDIASNKASGQDTADFSEKEAVYSGASTSTANQYWKFTISGTGACRPSVILRYTNSGSPFYEVQFDTVNVHWNHWTAVAGTKTPITTPGFVCTFPATIGGTITGTGNSTVIRLWLSPTANAPDAGGATWDSASPTLTISDDPPSAVNTGALMGVGGFSSGVLTWDDFFGGDVP